MDGAMGGNAGNAEGAEKDQEGQGEDKAQRQSATLQDWQSRLQQGGSKVSIRSSASQTIADIRQTTLRYIFNLLFSYRRGRFGQWMSEDSLGEYRQSVANGSQNAGQESGGAAYDNALQGEQKPGVTNVRILSYSSDILRIEKEEASFSTVGTVRTADGREISFNVNVNMSREFQLGSDMAVRAVFSHGPGGT